MPFNQNILVFFAMLFGHFVGDYFLQNKNLSSCKRKAFWKDKGPYEEVKYNFASYLMLHGYVWSFCVMFPIFLLVWTDTTNNVNIVKFYVGATILNAMIHATIDHLKANKRLFNDIADQSFHLLQIFITWIIWLIITAA